MSIKCNVCETEISKKVASYSRWKLGDYYCKEHQNNRQCSKCGTEIDKNVAIYSYQTFGEFRCREHQSETCECGKELSNNEIKYSWKNYREYLCKECQKNKDTFAEQKMNEVTDNIEEIIENGGINFIEELIEEIGYLHNYSFTNLMLIQLQGGGRIVKGRKQWEKEGYQVKEDAKGINILAPQQKKKWYKNEYTTNLEGKNISELKSEIQKKEKVSEVKIEKLDGNKVRITEKRYKKYTYFVTVEIYDISQLKNGDEIETFKNYLPKKDELLGENILPLLVDYATINKIKVDFEDLDKSTKLRGLSTNGSIEINDNLHLIAQGATLIHEIAHEILNHHNRDLSKEVAEIEADMVKCVVMSYFGVDTKTPEYLSLHSKSDKEERYQIFKKSIDRIKKVSGEIIDFLETEINKQLEKSA